jgi:hypothetical protein
MSTVCQRQKRISCAGKQTGKDGRPKGHLPAQHPKKKGAAKTIKMKCDENLSHLGPGERRSAAEMVPEEGLEPPTYRLQGGCSTS